MNTLEQINKVLSAKAEALIARSSVHLSEIIDDDFIYINSQGKKLNKAQYIEQCTVGALKFKSQRFENIEIQDFDSFAVATMILHDEFEYSDQFYAGSFQSLCVFKKTESAWVWTAGQTCAIKT